MRKLFAVAALLVSCGPPPCPPTAQGDYIAAVLEECPQDRPLSSCPAFPRIVEEYRKACVRP